MMETLGESTEYHKIRYIGPLLVYHDGWNDNHPQNFPEELIRAVVSLLLVLANLCDVNIWIFLKEY